MGNRKDADATDALEWFANEESLTIFTAIPVDGTSSGGSGSTLDKSVGIATADAPGVTPFDTKRFESASATLIVAVCAVPNSVFSFCE